ncbi:MAG: PAS domain S-box protein [Nibricoccus sp.]
MSWLNNLPVQRKLGLAMLVTTIVGLLVACTGFVVVEYLANKRSLIYTVSVLSRITAENSTATLAFSDERTAAQNLAALRAEPQILGAILCKADGTVLASFPTVTADLLNKARNKPPGIYQKGSILLIVHPVVENQRRLGTLYVEASMSGVYQRLRAYGFVVLGVVILSLVLAWQIAAVLRRTLARPILDLAQTAEAVSIDQDYSRRVPLHGQDELGHLTRAFNEMLEKTHAAVHALTESEWRYRELVRALPTAAYMCDQHGRLTVFNQAAVELWGRTPDAGKDFWCGSYKAYKPDGTPLSLENAPLAVALREGRSSRGEEVILERPDGTRRHVTANPEPIRDTNGKIVGIVNMLLDITEQKRADAAAYRLAAIVESSDYAIISKDLNGIVATWNRGAEHLFGYTAEEIIGKPITLLIPPDRLNEENTILERLRRGEAIRYDETVRRRRDGSLVDVSLRISPIKTATGEIIGASKIVHDITERKQAQLYNNFLSHLSHQLATVTDPDEIIASASTWVGQLLGADRCYFSTINDDGASVTVKDDWAREGFASIAGSYQPADFGTAELWEALRTRPLAVDNIATHPLVLNRGSGYAAIRVASHASVPFRRHNIWIASLTVTSEKPRIWRNDEMSLLENIVARIWPMVERARSVKDLLESERQQREMMQSLPVPCYTLDREGRLTFYNEPAAELWGRKPDLGITRWTGAVSETTLEGTVLLPQELPAAIALREKRAVRGSEGYVIRSDGTRRWVVPYPDPIIDAEGNCTGVVTVVMDLTEERTAQNAIRKAADHLNLAMASANLGDWNWDLTKDVVSLSPRMAEIFDLGQMPEISRPLIQKMIHPGDAERARSALDAALNQGTDYSIEYRIIRADGAIRWLATKGRRVVDASGTPQGMVGVVQDITDRKEQEEALKRLSTEIKTQAQLFDATLSNITDLAYTFDLHGRWIYANKPLLDLWGKSLDQVVGKNCYELGYPPEIAAKLQQDIQQVITTKSSLRGEMTYVRANGQADAHEYIFSPVVDPQGEVTAVVGTTRVITERKNAEDSLKRARDEAMAASRAKDDFLAALSHELRTPLNPVLLLASAGAKEAEFPVEVREQFELIRKNVELEARLIDDLLDLTRITRGKVQLDHRPCDVHAVLRDAMANVRADLADKKLLLSTDFRAENTTVWGDPVRLQQVFWNILKNAVKFTPTEGLITIGTADGEGTLRIVITDTGIGMTQEEIGLAFKAFSQGEHAASGQQFHQFGGLGLGLAISKMLVELHQGRVTATSAGRNQGASFTVELPRLLNTAEEKAPTVKKGSSRRINSLHPLPPGNGNPLPSSAKRHRILLVEDHSPTRMTLQHLLAARNFDVFAVNTAAEASKIAAIYEFSLLISDVGLPDKNGYELMTELRNANPSIMGIALSGYGMEEDLARSRAAGFAVHLVKPVAISVLEEAIGQLLSAPV